MSSHHRNVAYRPPRQTDRQGSTANAFARLFHDYLWPHRWLLLLCALLTSLTACSPYMLAFYSRIVVDRILVVESAVETQEPTDLSPMARERIVQRSTPRSDSLGRRRFELGFGLQASRPPDAMRRLWSIFLALAATLISLNLAQRVISRARVRVSQRMSEQLRNELHEKILHLSVAYHVAQTPGRLVSRITSDVRQLQMQAVTGVLEMFSHSIAILVGIIILSSIQWQMAVVLLACLPLYAFAYRRDRMRLVEVSREMRHTNTCLYGLTSQKFEGIKAVQAYGRQKTESLNFHRLSSVFLRDALTAERYSASLSARSQIISSVATGLIFVLGTRQVLAGHISLGDMMLAHGSAASLFAPAIALTQLALSFNHVGVVLNRVLHVLDRPIEIEDVPNAVPFPNPLVNGFHVNRVDFRYEDESEHALQEIDLKLKAGTWVCVMGPSGSGKTTLIHLLSRLFEPTHGEIMVDGQPLSRIQLRTLRRHVAVVPQEAQIFQGSVRQNICYGFPDASPTQIMVAAKNAELHDFIMQNLPVQYETLLSERGTNLSGGQRQRLSLARALLTDPDVLLLDDCTSALDAHTERRIQDTLRRILPGKTAVIVSQRVSMARACHKICVLEQGRITQLGTHDELANQPGFYSRLLEQQMNP